MRLTVPDRRRRVRGTELLPVEALVIVTLLLLLVGCAGPTRDPDYAVVRPVEIPQTPPRAGSLYAPTQYRMALFEDLKARRVGDILTVRLVEKTNASKSTETNVDQETDFNIENPTLFGVSPSVQIGSETVDLESRLQSNKLFDGKGESSQSNSLTGDISVTVAEVLSNGDLVVQGEKIFTLNRGHEHIRLSGVVRTADITPDNTVLSTKIANATIIYAGEGEVADASKIAWLARFFLGVFFPF